MGRYKINIDRSVLKLLGSQLYGDIPSVMSELVANSYDAGANNVWITLLTAESQIIIEDDGEGMSVEEINDHFLNIGYNKRSASLNEKDSTNNKKTRVPMGRKGIGKLAAFSLSNEMKVYSCKNGNKAGCILDFKKITLNNEQPEEIPETDITFSKDRLSSDKSGTRIELNQISKKIAYSYRYIVNKLIRLFEVNEDDFTIYIKRNNEEFKPLHRGDINYFSIMDCILTVDRDDCFELVNQNDIPERYKSVKKYENFIEEQSGRNPLQKFPYLITVENKDGVDVAVDFSLKGWIGTVKSLPDLKKLQIGEEENNKDQIEINDNRISLYSRGKLGEYDILSKIKSNSNNEAYVVGEFFIDIFEDDRLVDMAISNRRGYEESDQRYIEAIKIIKRLLNYIMKQKRIVNKNQTDDDKQKEVEKIKEEFIKDKAVKDILVNKLDENDRNTLQNANQQFMRAVNVQNATRKIFISHKYEEQKFGQFIVDVLAEYGVNVSENVIFTSDNKSRTGVPMGGDIFDYLKECFRDDLLVVFLFSKAFYNSVPCVSEVGAAWATNKKSINAVIDIGFGDIQRPTHNTTIGLTISQAGDTSQQVNLENFFIFLIENGIGENADRNKVKMAINEVIKAQYSAPGAFTPDKIKPNSKFMPKPICPKCNNAMEITEDSGKLLFMCRNLKCKNVLEAEY